MICYVIFQFNCLWDSICYSEIMGSDDMTREEYILKGQLLEILSDAYKDSEKYKNFRVTITAKELKSKHGRYIQNDRRIEIFNLSRSPGANLLTAVHELAHHIEVIDIGDTGHKKSFYERMYLLVCSAIKLGYLDERDLISDSKDSNDYSKLQKYFGSHLFEKYEKSKILNAVRVENGYDSRKLLHRRQFSFLDDSKSWGRIFETEAQAKKEKDILESFDNDLSISLVSPSELVFLQNYYIAVPGAYDCKDELYNNGFIWNGYGHNKCWVKRISSKQYSETMEFLKELRLKGKKVDPKN